MALKIGDEILDGKYRIEKALGEGAFGKVFLAQDQYLNRQVAIKELRRGDWTDEKYAEFRRRFQREAQIGASLKHQNVVDVYTLERSGDDFYLVMEYVDGPSLAERLEERGPLPVEDAVEIAMQICEGLAAVHDHPLGIIHRDIKPSNILLTSQGQPKITDFGLAQLHGESLRSLGKGARHPGTPAYMSPKQETSSGYLRPASDIYSLGCVLFEMLTGNVYKRVEGSKASEWRPEVPGWLDEVVAGMLTEEKVSRYQEAARVKVELQAGLSSETDRKCKEEQGGWRRLLTAITGVLASVGTVGTLGAIVAVVLACLGTVWLVWWRPSFTPTPIAYVPAPASGSEPTETSTATETNTDVPTSIPTYAATPSPTSTPAHAATATLTAMTTSTATRSPVPSTPAAPAPSPSFAHTVLPSPAMEPYPAPSPSESIREQGTVTLVWTWPGHLGPDEYFDVRICPTREGPGIPMEGYDCHTGVAWTKDTQFTYAPPGWITDVWFCWSVAVIRGQAGTMLAQLSPESELRWFRDPDR